MLAGQFLPVLLTSEGEVAHVEIYEETPEIHKEAFA